MFILKKKNLKSIVDLRLISLCNVIYKIMAKALANRLKFILPSLISESQSVFVPGRLISDNVLIAFKIRHYFKRKIRGKDGWAALKIYMFKAYDHYGMMVRMGFHMKWIGLIMSCISFVNY